MPSNANVNEIRMTASDEWHATLVVAGELDAALARRLRAELLRHLDLGRRVVHVDAGGVRTMDPAATGDLVAVNDRFRRVHGTLILTNVPPCVREIARNAGLDAILLIDTAGDGAALSVGDLTVGDVEDRGKVGDLDKAVHLGRGATQCQLDALAKGTVADRHQRADAGGVDESDRRQVDDEALA